MSMKFVKLQLKKNLIKKKSFNPEDKRSKVTSFAMPCMLVKQPLHQVE